MWSFELYKKFSFFFVFSHLLRGVFVWRSTCTQDLIAAPQTGTARWVEVNRATTHAKVPSTGYQWISPSGESWGIAAKACALPISRERRGQIRVGQSQIPNHINLRRQDSPRGRGYATLLTKWLKTQGLCSSTLLQSLQGALGSRRTICPFEPCFPFAPMTYRAMLTHHQLQRSRGSHHFARCLPKGAYLASAFWPQFLFFFFFNTVEVFYSGAPSSQSLMSSGLQMPHFKRNALSL